MKIKMNNAVGPQVRSAKPKPSKLLPILGGVSLVNGDGLLRRGPSTLYVVQNRLNSIAVLKLDRSFTSGTLKGAITDPRFDVPTTIAAFGNSLYAVNARFGVANPDSVPYSVVRVDARP